MLPVTVEMALMTIMMMTTMAMTMTKLLLPPMMMMMMLVMMLLVTKKKNGHCSHWPWERDLMVSRTNARHWIICAMVRMEENSPLATKW